MHPNPQPLDQAGTEARSLRNAARADPYTTHHTPSSLNTHHSTLNTRHSTLNTQHSTLTPQPSTLQVPRRATRAPRASSCGRCLGLQRLGPVRGYGGGDAAARRQLGAPVDDGPAHGVPYTLTPNPKPGALNLKP